MALDTYAKTTTTPKAKPVAPKSPVTTALATIPSDAGGRPTAGAYTPAPVAPAPAAPAGLQQWGPGQIDAFIGKYGPNPMSPADIDAAIAKYTSAYPAPFTPEQQQQYLDQTYGRYAAPLTQEEIRAQAQAAIDPVIAKITEAINLRAQGQQAAVQGYTGQLMQNLSAAAPTLSQPYYQAAQGVAATSNALADRLAGGGQQAGQDLAARLASINAPGAVGAAAGQAAQQGAGAGNALFAQGGADINALLQNAASAQSYGAKQPGIAALGGIQQSGLVARQAVMDTAERTAEAQGQFPALVQALTQMSENRSLSRSDAVNAMQQLLINQGQTAQTNRADAGVNLYGNLTGQNVTREGQIADLAATLLGQNITKATAVAGLRPEQQAITAGGGIYSFDPQTGKVTPQVKPGAIAQEPQIVTVGDGIYAIDPATKKLTVLKQPTATTERQTVTIGDGIFQIDPKTNTLVTLREPSPNSTNQIVSTGGGIYSVNPDTSTSTTIKNPPPSSPSAPQTKVDPATGKLIQWNGSKWIPAPGASTAPVVDTGARQSAMVSADKTVRSILTAAAKPVTQTVPGAGGALSIPTTKEVVPRIGSAAYNAAVNRAVISAMTALSPYMSPAEVTRFVQQRALAAGFLPAPQTGGSSQAAIPPYLPGMAPGQNG